MKSVLNFFKKQDFKNSLRDTLYRFPVSVSLCVIVTTLFFVLIATWPSMEYAEEIGKYILTIIITFFLSLWVSILQESIDISKWKWYVLQLWVLVFWALFYFSLPSDLDDFSSFIRFLITLFGIIGALYVAPYLQYIKKWTYAEQWYYVYFYRISVVFFLSFIVWWALALLGNIAILTITTLFDIWYGLWWDVHAYWTVISLCLLTPYFGLSQIPKKWSFEEKKFEENAFFHFLIRYIALPFIYVYFIILYAYTLKVLINFSHWPKGEVSWMVIGFSIFWYIIYIFSYIFEQWKKQKSHKLIHIFRKYFPLIILPQIGMLFYAIFLRIHQYDFTVNRYFVVAFGIWLLICSLYLIFSQRKTLLFIPLLLTVFTLIISVGPWSVYSFPLERQIQRLEKNLVVAWIRNEINKEITPLNNHSDISEDLSRQIYDGIDYLCDFDNCDAVKEIFPKLYNDLYTQDRQDFATNSWKYEYKASATYDVEYTEPSTWEIKNYIQDTIKVSWSYGFRDDNMYRIDSATWYVALNVEWYDYVLLVDTYKNSLWDIKVQIDAINQELIISTWDIQERASLATAIETIRQTYAADNTYMFNTSKDRFEFQTDLYTWVFIPKTVSIFSDANYEPLKYENEYISGYILLKSK